MAEWYTDNCQNYISSSFDVPDVSGNVKYLYVVLDLASPNINNFRHRTN